jgi:hypothetical protein
VIDILSALERIVSPRELLDFVIAMGAVVRQNEVTTLLTSAPTVAPAVTPAIAMEIASLTDAMILYGYIETAGEVQRCVTVLQTRASAHDHSIRQFTIDGNGMHIGEPVANVAQIVPTTSALKGRSLTARRTRWPDLIDGRADGARDVHRTGPGRASAEVAQPEVRSHERHHDGGDHEAVPRELPEADGRTVAGGDADDDDVGRGADPRPVSYQG